MKMLSYLLLYCFLTTLFCCCTSKPPAPTIVNQAPDYSPIGESVKFIGLCFLGVSVVIAVTTILKQLLKK